MTAGPTVIPISVENVSKKCEIVRFCSFVFGKQWTRHSNALLGGVWIFSSVFFHLMFGPNIVEYAVFGC